MRKLTTDFGSEDIYKYYCSKTGNPYKLSQKEYTDITRQFFLKIFDALIFKGIEFNFPNRLGNLRIRKSKIKFKLDKDGKLNKSKLAPNWKATKELWSEKYPGKTLKELKSIKDKPIVYHLNRHTDGYKHNWFWDKSTCIAKNSTGYSIEVVRSMDRKLAKALQDEDLHLDYSLF